MRILLLVSAFNGLTQRAQIALRHLGHQVSVELAISDQLIREGIALFQP